MSGVRRVGNGALEGPIEASRASEGLGLFDFRGLLWSPLDEKASEAWPLHVDQPRPLTVVILIQTGWLTH